ncbi:hypothetical protein SAMN05444141_103700 [Pseudovibrio denitrificans]|uniref:Uncharacterized protein n=1 Tax=Pseudovibrio denitrificans TaxID=258256 RepID=A0A1I7B6S5_9HYPH|nr:hypothetical protein SAMN05444141_103700 [Pseudovibrio denitrificans]
MECPLYVKTIDSLSPYGVSALDFALTLKLLACRNSISNRRYHDG